MSNRFRSEPRSLIVLLLTGVVALPIGWRVDRTRWTVGSDGTKYIQSAENLLAGRGLVHTPHGPTPYDTAWEPLRLWPPGLPLLIASVKAVTHGNAARIGLGISRVAWVLIPALLIWCLRPLNLGLWSVPVGLLVAFSPGVFASAQAVQSDLPFLVLVLVALGLTIEVAEGTRRPLWMVGAGLASGAAFGMRNAGSALLLAIPLGLAAGAWLAPSVGGLRRVQRHVGLWLLGASLPVVAVVGRSVSIFHRLLPYDMLPSTVGLVTNLRGSLVAILFEISGIRRLAWPAWNGRMLLVAVAALPLLLILGFFATRSVTRDSARGRPRVALVILCVYAVLAAAIVVYGRTRYEWGELINVRHVLQFAWILVAFAAIGARAWWHKGSYLRVAVTGVVVVFILARCMNVWNYLDASNSSSGDLALARDHSLVEGLRSIAEGAFILSNRGPLLTAISGVGVRNIASRAASGRANPFASELERLHGTLGPQREVCFVAVGSPEVRTQVVADLPAAFHVVAERPRFVALCTAGVEWTD